MNYELRIMNYVNKILFALILGVGILLVSNSTSHAASPTIQSVTATLFAADTTAHAVAMPATVGVGDLLLVLFANDGSATVTTPDGWTLIASNARSTFVRGVIYAKTADGANATSLITGVVRGDEGDIK